MKSLPADNIHQRLCDLRNSTGKSQKEVADELNIPASVLSRVERGGDKISEPRSDYKICRILSCFNRLFTLHI